MFALNLGLVFGFAEISGCVEVKIVGRLLDYLDYMMMSTQYLGVAHH